MYLFKAISESKLSKDKVIFDHTHYMDSAIKIVYSH